MFIVLTNDDGIYAKGLRAMYNALRAQGHTVQVIAPLGEQSAVGHSITVLSPLRVKKVEESSFSGLAVSGTPTDCIKLGLSQLIDQKPDLVVSGINAGGNVGPDVLYSGTVAAATEAAAMGLNAFAVSHNSFTHVDIEKHATFAAGVIPQIPWEKLPAKRVMNLNLPECMHQDMKGLALCTQTDVHWHDWYHERTDPRGRTYWWLDGDIPIEKVKPGTDKYLLEQGWATLTPLKFDFTDYECLNLLQTNLNSAEFFAEGETSQE